MSANQTGPQRLELLAKAMIGRYRLGYKEVALYLAGTLFEGLINSKLVGWDEDKIEATRMQDKIEAIETSKLLEDSLFRHQEVFQKYYEHGTVKPFSTSDNDRVRQVRRRLNNFRWLRNKIMHNQLDQLLSDESDMVEDLVVYLWSELAADSFHKALNKRKHSESIVQTLFEHTADYMVRAIDEVESLERDKACGHAIGATFLTNEDFENLFELRRKLVYLKNYLSDWLANEADFLQTDILTTIDTTSAYVWMPLVSRELAGQGRRGVYDCSVSILATPLDFRIYMDFGGYTRDQRKTFYDFLDGSPEYENAAINLLSKPGIEVFDIDWYSAIFNQNKLSVWLPQRDNALAEARNKLKSTPKPESSPITWNRCLHGYVMSKHDLREGTSIDFAMIESKLRDIIAFYQAFQHFKERARKGDLH